MAGRVAGRLAGARCGRIMTEGKYSKCHHHLFLAVSLPLPLPLSLPPSPTRQSQSVTVTLNNSNTTNCNTNRTSNNNNVVRGGGSVSQSSTRVCWVVDGMGVPAYLVFAGVASGSVGGWDEHGWGCVRPPCPAPPRPAPRPACLGHPGLVVTRASLLWRDGGDLVMSARLGAAPRACVALRWVGGAALVGARVRGRCKARWGVP